MTSIPWAYVTPSLQYRKTILIAQRCPEIAHIVHRRSFLRLKMIAWAVVLLPVWAVLAPLFVAYAIGSAAEWATSQVLRLFAPLIAAHDEYHAQVNVAHRILAPDQIGKRIR